MCWVLNLIATFQNIVLSEIPLLFWVILGFSTQLALKIWVKTLQIP